eukprot:449493-Pleurochrysis_carterae.AAC.1
MPLTRLASTRFRTAGTDFACARSTKSDIGLSSVASWISRSSAAASVAAHSVSSQHVSQRSTVRQTLARSGSADARSVELEPRSCDAAAARVSCVPVGRP